MHPLDGARERLKRAEENIQNLNEEIIEFLSPVPVVVLDVDVAKRKPIISDENRESYNKLTEFVKSQTVKPRFGVLAGEIVHHLRSAFDNLAWQLSSHQMQADHPTKIEFPVFRERPKLCGITKDKMCRYCRKIEGISSPSALTRIEGLQPYKSSNPVRDKLWLIHDMDRFDKHRALVLTVHIMSVNITSNTRLVGLGIQMPWERIPRPTSLGKTHMDMKVKMAPQITFAEFNKRDDQTIIPTLFDFLNFTRNSIDSFAEEFA